MKAEDEGFQTTPISSKTVRYVEKCDALKIADLQTTSGQKRRRTKWGCHKINTTWANMCHAIIFWGWSVTSTYYYCRYIRSRHRPSPVADRRLRIQHGRMSPNHMKPIAVVLVITSQTCMRIFSVHWTPRKYFGPRVSDPDPGVADPSGGV